MVTTCLVVRALKGLWSSPAPRWRTELATRSGITQPTWDRRVLPTIDTGSRPMSKRRMADASGDKSQLHRVVLVARLPHLEDAAVLIDQSVSPSTSMGAIGIRFSLRRALIFSVLYCDII